VIEVVSPGPLTTVQDLGRPGHAALGVGRSGAADRASLRRANRLVGNPEGAAALELTMGGLRVRFSAGARVALAGAPCPLRAGDRSPAMDEPFELAAGDELRVRPPAWGLRTYLAVTGGIAADPVLGSRSTDTLSGLGPAPLRAGHELVVGTGGELVVGAGGEPVVGTGGEPVVGAGGEPVDASSPPALRVLAGPRQDWFVAGALDTLCAAEWTVTPRSDRVGLRLDGPRLERAERGELPPEGMVEGALQVPPDGRPVLFLADHPVTGGYPVIAVVAEADVALAAQARPGSALRFTEVWSSGRA
jgi:biotin-dependent carboxylase-like uncharacterized protein